MELEEKTLRYHEIFNPGLIDEIGKVVREKTRFVYYTSAETAMSILRNNELWLRNATVMNDFSEINYGLNLVKSVFSGPEGDRFRNAVEDIFPGTIKKADELFSVWEHDLRLETYIACVSLHDVTEDKQGRLSMWRAYGDTALVVNNTPMVAFTDLLEVFSTPVLYYSADDLTNHISKITDAILINRRYLIGLGQETINAYLHAMLLRLAIAIKHPGFSEEKEWRIYYRPSEGRSPAIDEGNVVISGVPQKICKLKLANDPDKGLHQADIPSLLDRVIIGPTQYPYVVFRTFVDVLEGLGVTSAADKVVVSDIPLRTG